MIAAIAGNSMDLCNIGSSPMVVGFAQGIKMSMVYVEKYITDSECLAVRKDAGIKRHEGPEGQEESGCRSTRRCTSRCWPG